MKKIIISIWLLLFILSATAQRSYSDAEIKRFADLGRLWGMLNYFHPKMGTGEINTDSLVLSPAASLAADPSAANFKQCVINMVGRLDDPATNVQENISAPASLLFTPSPYKSAVHKLPGDIWYISFPTAAFDRRRDGDPFKIQGLIPEQWDSAKAIIFDIRNAGKEDLSDIFFKYYIIPGLTTFLLGSTLLPQIFERSIYHNGLVPQEGSGFIYNSGWRTISTENPDIATKANKFNKPVIIVFNSNTGAELVQIIQALKSAGVCKLVFEGPAASYPVGRVLPVVLTDSLIVNIRVSDYLSGKNLPVPCPDLQTDRITDTSLSGQFVKACIDLLADNNKDVKEKVETPFSFQYVIPKPGRYSEDKFPSVEKRLYALYNWWNAIHYFSPYKKLIGRDWDSVLYQYIPRMLNAKDTLSYDFAVRGMVSEIKDSHGVLNYGGGPNPSVRNAIGFWPPVQLAFFENKLIIFEKEKDGLQDMSKVEIWDEITHINGKPVSVAVNDWRYFFTSSNESTYYRDVVSHLLRGPKNSIVKLGLLRNGKSLTVELSRTGRTFLNDDRISFNDNYSAVQMLEGNIGYINMGSLKRMQVDSTMSAFENTRAIIFDLRNYPQETAGIAQYLTSKEKKVGMYELPLVTYEYITDISGGWGKVTQVANNIVSPHDANKSFKGKVVILCDQNTQSQAEGTIMVLQAAGDNVTVIGSQTAGADGEVTNVVLPGGYTAVFTALGVLYPDGGQTQRTGIRIDIPVKPTIAGLKAGKDEVLLRAMEYIRKGK